MINYLIREYQNEEIFAFHQITILESSYTSVVSIHAFSNREHKRLYDYNNAQRAGKNPTNLRTRCTVRWVVAEVANIDNIDNTMFNLKQFIDDIKYLNQYETEKNKFKIIHHESIWDFYKFIGYDYKKKRYT